MIELLILSLGTAIGMFVMIKRFFKGRTIKAMSKYLDVGGFIMLAIVFFGTMSGMVIAMLAGLFFSGLLTLNNKVNDR
jgi:hypothetical protein